MLRTMATPPGPPLPGLLTIVPWIYRPFPFLDACAKRYPDVFTMRLPLLGDAVVFYHPNAVKEVFSLGPDDVHAGEVNAVLRPVVGKNSLLLLDGAEHLRQRKLLLPPLHGERMASYGERMVRLTEAEITRFPSRGAFPIHEHLQRITLDVILRVVFGLEDGARLEKMRSRISATMELGTSPFLLFPLFQKDLGAWSPWGRFVRAKASVDELLYAEIRRRRETGARGDDILSLLLDARDDEGRALSDEELRDELVTLLVAGHETTATSLSWALRWVLESESLTARLSRELEDCGALARSRARSHRAGAAARRDRTRGAAPAARDPDGRPHPPAPRAHRRARPRSRRARARLDLPRPAKARSLPGSDALRSGPLPAPKILAIRMAALRRRHPALHRHGVRALRNENGPRDDPLRARRCASRASAGSERFVAA